MGGTQRRGWKHTQRIGRDLTFPTRLRVFGPLEPFIGDYHAAVQHCHRCLELETKRADVLVLLGNLYNTLDQPLQACAAYQDALNVAPDDGEIVYNLACTQDRLGDLEAAVDNYRRARQLNPNIPDVNLRNAVAKLVAQKARKLASARDADAGPNARATSS